jgi:hypothetical protein
MATLALILLFSLNLVPQNRSRTTIAVSGEHAHAVAARDEALDRLVVTGDEFPFEDEDRHAHTGFHNLHAGTLGSFSLAPCTLHLAVAFFLSFSAKLQPRTAHI